ncbi:uncharacterized protein LOC119465023 [Dermacentor silvarum]|uniref:uncharacterized protein LOC119465023 n=1 Tax=Dermacentor silvarum TaxID=543639 RepID=UPI0021013668|nr:uncharacterized protein LOC119465023 [Dermacentor silvarum]
MLNFTVENATLINNLTVYYEQNTTINGNATLEALKNFTQNTSSIDTINYFFTSTQVWENSTYRADDIFTPDTFCTKNVTATVIFTLLDPRFYLTALKETIFMLGSRRTQRFRPEDYIKMNQTFWKCYQNNTMEVN